jgi:hypothetical protein
MRCRGMFARCQSRSSFNLIICSHRMILSIWHSNTELFLEEFIHLEGCGTYIQDHCFCGSNESLLYRCKDCHGAEAVCHQCILHIHQRQPYHQIKVWQFKSHWYLIYFSLQYWNGHFFQMTSLRSLGLHIQLGHCIGLQCSKPTPALNNDLLSLTSMVFIPLGLISVVVKLLNFTLLSFYKFTYSLRRQSKPTPPQHSEHLNTSRSCPLSPKHLPSSFITLLYD